MTRSPEFNLLTALFQDQATAELWSEDASIGGWLRAEAELALAQAEAGLLTSAESEAIATACTLENIDRPRLWAEARNVGYPILPLVRQIAGALPDGPSGRVHFGATTQDIMDTGLALQLAATCARLEVLLIRLGDALHVLTEKHATTVMAGRTHAQQAVPTTFGAKVAVFLEQVRQELEELRRTGDQLRVVSSFGAGGTSAAMGPLSGQVRSSMARRLDLNDAVVPWHVARGRVARFGLTAATISAVCARLAREVVDLSRTEIGELGEEAGHHRGASSTMPQKVNPISSESIIGLSVSASAAAGSLLRAMEAGHERAAGEWQIEWVAVPAVSVHTATAVALAAELIGSLQVFGEAMRRNLEAESGLIMSEAVMMRLAPALGRDRAHDVVYEAAARARHSASDLGSALRSTLSPELLAELGSVDPSNYLGEAEEICATATAAWTETRNHTTTEDRISRDRNTK